MKVYYNGKHKNQRIYVQPGAFYPEVSEWMVNNSPKMFTINFKNNMAEVSDSLGKYLIDNKLATKSKIVTIVDEVA